MAGKIGRMFKRKEGSGKTPPKALYDDLESAHESIARKGSAISLKRPSRINLPSSRETPSPNHSPSKSPIASYPTEPISMAKPGQPSPSSPRSQLSDSNVGPHGVVIAHDFAKLDSQVDISSAEHDVSSQWQTATTCSESAIHHPPSRQEGLPAHPNEFPAMVPIITETLDLGQPVVTQNRHPPIVASDTVDNILKTYGQCTPDDSRHIPQQRGFHDSLSINVLESYIEQRQGDDELSMIVLPQDVEEQYEAKDRKHVVAATTPIMGPHDVVAVETALLDEGDQHLAVMRPSESSESEPQTGLNQYAWSPCPSDDGIDDNVAVPDSQLSHLNTSQHHSDNPQTHGATSSIGDNTSSSPESYGNTRNLLELSNSQPSKETASNSIQSGGPLPSVRSSNLAGDLHLPKKGWPLSENRLSFRGLGRLSGIVSDGTSSRPMSEVEVIESLSELVQSTLKAPSQSETSSLAASRGPNAEDRNIARQAIGTVLGRRVGDIATDLGPESSQDTTSSSHDISSGDLQVRKTREELHIDTSSPRTRAATPPGLFGRTATIFTTDSSESRPSLMRNNSRLAQAAAAAGVKEDGRLGRALAGSPEQDWLTETEIKTSAEHTVVAHIDPITGSSLADNSDTGDFSYTGGSQQNASDLDQDDFMTHPAHPRYNHSWSLLKNLQTGSLAMVPDYISREGNRLPNTMNTSQSRSFTNPGPGPHYHHPKPLPKGHSHPLSSSPLITPSRIELREIAQGHELTTQQKRMEIETSNSEYSYVSDDAEKGDHHQVLFSPSGSVGRSREATDKDLEASGGLNTPGQLPSSTWLSTVSEGPTTEPSLPHRISSFARMSLLGLKGNLTGSPDGDGDGAREVGSSLADNSSPGQEFWSSPPVFTSSPLVHRLSPIADYTTPIPKPENAVQAFHRHLEAIDPGPDALAKLSSSRAHDSFGYIVDRSQNRLSSRWEDSPSTHAHDRHMKKRFLHSRGKTISPSSPLARDGVKSLIDNVAPMKPNLNPSSIFSIHDSDEQEHFDWLKYLPALGPPRRLANRRGSPHEKEHCTQAVPPAKDIPSTQPTSKTGHQKRRSAVQSLGRYTVKSADLESGVPQGDEGENPEKHHRPVHRQYSEIHPRFSQTRTDHTSIQPMILDQGAFGPKFARRQALRYPEMRTNPYARPDARLSSPHLYRVPFRPDFTTTKQAAYCSRMWISICVLFPFLGIVFGHGYLDHVMSWHTEGLVSAFPNKEKTAVLIYSYTFFFSVAIAASLIAIFEK